MIFRNKCRSECPQHSHCEWSYCECDIGYVKFKGKCYVAPLRLGKIDTKDRTGFQCSTESDCSSYDINLTCENSTCRYETVLPILF